jgi:hypothetical protein
MSLRAGSKSQVEPSHLRLEPQLDQPADNFGEGGDTGLLGAPLIIACEYKSDANRHSGFSGTGL